MQPPYFVNEVLFGSSFPSTSSGNMILLTHSLFSVLQPDCHFLMEKTVEGSVIHPRSHWLCKEQGQSLNSKFSLVLVQGPHGSAEGTNRNLRGIILMSQIVLGPASLSAGPSKELRSFYQVQIHTRGKQNSIIMLTICG